MWHGKERDADRSDEIVSVGTSSGHKEIKGGRGTSRGETANETGRWRLNECQTGMFVELVYRI
jgi:hypothetical protein